MRRSFIVAVLCAFGAACGSASNDKDGSSSSGSGNDSGIGGSPFCESVGAFTTAWKEKVGSCGSIATPTTPGSTGSSNSCGSCSACTASCTSADKAVIDDYTACLNDAPTCTPSTENAWLTSLAPCFENAGSLSSGCSSSGGSDGG